MVTHPITSTLPQDQWSPKRYRRLLMLATIAPILTLIAFARFDAEPLSWPTAAIVGIGLASIVLVHARTTRTVHRRLWVVLASLPIAFWTLAIIMTVFVNS